MKGYVSDSYGNSFDDAYEAIHSGLLPDPAPMVSELARHAGAGPALELGVGTGRVARPLAALGVEVDGIEVSAKMIEQLRRSADGLPLTVLAGDFGEMKPPRSYRLIYCVWSTFFYLTTRDAQSRALDRVARALDADGVFVLEVYTPDPGRFRHGQEAKVIDLAAGSVTLQFSLHDPDRQIIETQRVIMGGDGIQLHPVINRYAPPGELDEMAAEAGLRLRDRWADWSHAPFTEHSRSHVSVYEQA
jgi:SAM-dependent methyltransferase